jgi:branched-chain amino acid transport system substrate-binding protein
MDGDSNMANRTVQPFILICLTLLSLGCSGGARAQTGAIAIGILAPLTSGVPGAAKAVVQGAELAAQEVNTGAATGSLTLFIEDDRGSPEQSLRLFDDLRAKKVLAVVGPLTDATAAALAPVAERTGTVLITPGATGTIPYAGSAVFRTSLPAQAQARVLAEHLVGDKRLRIVVIHEGNDYGTLVALAFTQRVRELGGDVVGTRLYKDGATDFTRHANGVVADGAHAVFIAGYPDEAVHIVTALKARGVDVPIAGSDALYSPDVLLWPAEVSTGLLVPAPFVASEPIPFVQQFVGKYRRAYNQTPDHYAAQGYDAVKIVASVARRNRTPEAVRTALQGLRRFPGATGEITFDRWGAPDRSVAVAVVKERQFVVVRR